MTASGSSPAPTFDLVIHDATILTMNLARDVVRGWLGIRDGVIAAVHEGVLADSGLAATSVIDAGGALLRPGYISGHQHSMDALARGTVTGLPDFFDWLFGDYYGTVLDYAPEDAGRAAALTAADLVRAGVTTVLDCWGVGDPGSARSLACFEATLAAARASGLRWLLAPMVSDVIPEGWDTELTRVAAARHKNGSRPAAAEPGALCTDTDSALAAASDFAALTAPGELVRVWAAAELPEMSTDALLTGLAAVADSHGTGFTTHLCASPAGAEGLGERAVARLDRLGVTDVRTVAAHLVFAEPEELHHLADRGVGAVHCATATAMLGGGRSALGEFLDSGIAVALGLDNASLNFTADFTGELRQALLFDRSNPSGTSRVSPDQLLTMATIGGAAALGLADLTGSLEVGKSADLVLVDTAGLHWQPQRPLADAIVFQERADDILTVVSAGRVLWQRP